MSSIASLSPAAVDAVAILGLQVAAGRRARRMTARELAERAGVSLPTLRNIERGVPTVGIGTVFEVATLVGVELFGLEAGERSSYRRREQDRLAVLPSRVRPPTTPVDDDF